MNRPLLLITPDIKREVHYLVEVNHFTSFRIIINGGMFLSVDLTFA